MRPRTQHPLMTSGEVAQLFRVNRPTVLRWVREGLLARAQTPSGHARFQRAEVYALARANGIEP